MTRESYRLMIMLAAILILGVSASMAHAHGKQNCPLCEAHKDAQVKGLTPTRDAIVCIRGEVAGPTKVTFHFLRPDGTDYRPSVARIYNGKWHISFRRTSFEEVQRGGGVIRVCAGEGEIGVRFEAKDVEEHLHNGPKCASAPVCLFHGLVCPSEHK